MNIIDIILSEIFYFWLIIAFICLMLEMGSPGLFFFLSFFVGALAAAGTSLISQLLIIQGAAFLGGTIITLFVLKQWLAQKMFKGHQQGRTNVFALQGKYAIVIRDIMPDNPGEVKINGEIWMARANEVITKGETVEIVVVRGAHVVVKFKTKGT